MKTYAHILLLHDDKISYININGNDANIWCRDKVTFKCNQAVVEYDINVSLDTRVFPVWQMLMCRSYWENKVESIDSLSSLILINLLKIWM